MTDAFVDLEVVQRNAAIGLRFWDVATGNTVVDDLRVELYRAATPTTRRVALSNRSGVYTCLDVPGLRSFEFDDSTTPDPLWTTATVTPYRVEVSDPRGRFLPIVFDAGLPARGLFTWFAPWLSPPHAIALGSDGASPPGLMAGRIPLFSAPSRQPPEPLAVAYAQLQEFGSARPLAWALLGVSIDGAPQGLGLADAQGRVAVMFPYPEPPRRMLASPPEARSDFGWSVTLTAFVGAASPPAPVPVFADLGLVLGQLARPRPPIDADASPSLPWRLDYRVPLTARSSGQPPPDDSVLLIAP